MGLLKLILILIIGLFVVLPMLKLFTDGFTGTQTITPYKYAKTDTDLSLYLMQGN